MHWLFLTILPRKYSYQQLPFLRLGPTDCKDRGTTKLLRSGTSDFHLTATSTCITWGQAGPKKLRTTSVLFSRYHRENRYSPEGEFCSPCTLSTVCSSDFPPASGLDFRTGQDQQSNKLNIRNFRKNCTLLSYLLLSKAFRGTSIGIPPT